jgi:predicted ester cyclase
MQSEEERKALARLPFDSINRKDMSLLESHPGYWETRQVFPLLWSAFPDLVAQVEQQTVQEEWVTSRATLRGTHLGTFLGLAPSGKKVEMMHLSLDKVSEGKVVEHFGTTDWKTLINASLISKNEPT